MISWQWTAFSDLLPDDLYEILSIRQKVFVCEMHSLQLDTDGLDRASYHLLGWIGEGTQRRLAAYMRVMPPGVIFDEVSFGKVVTLPEERRKGIGREMMEEALKKIYNTFGDVPIRISVPAYLRRFYQSFGFQPIGDAYNKDGIAHTDMRKEEEMSFA